MPVEMKHLAGPASAIACNKKARSKAFKAGEEAYRTGKMLSACPKEFKPVMGDSAMFDSFCHGFRAAEVARVPRRPA